jgi:multidrug resistance protein MdtO
MRVLFIVQIAEWKYRAQLPGFELPEAIAVQQREFDDRLAESLGAMADRIEGRSAGVQLTLQETRARALTLCFCSAAKSNRRFCPSLTRSEWRKCIARLRSGSHGG